MKVIITGGLGFIGSNAAEYYLKQGWEVVIVDDLSRPGVEKNRSWLEHIAKESTGALQIFESSVCHFDALSKIFSGARDAELVLHLAGQVAVTHSVTQPRIDFETNALGTFNVLEAMRILGMKSLLIYASTNKVYGSMEDALTDEADGRYFYTELSLGISEKRPLDFHSPYGCSKGAADQYIRDYHRIYGIKTVVMRQSCIYGMRQMGAEDQGWIAWFMIAACSGRPITVYGDGKQVRDALFISDLIALYDKALERQDQVAGSIYNVGGGVGNVLSVLDVIRYLEKKMGHSIPVAFSDYRPGDQKIYVSDIRRVEKDLDWRPQIPISQGLDLLYEWVLRHLDLFK